MAGSDAGRRGQRAFVATVAVVLAVAVAGALPVAAMAASARRYAPLPGGSGLLGVHEARPLPHLGLVAGLALDYAADELVGETAAGPSARLIGHRVTSELGVGLGLFERVDILLSLPLYVLVSRIDVPGQPDERASGLGDLRVAPRVAIVRADGPGFGLGLVAEATFPTGRGDHFLSDGGVTVAPRVTLEWRFAGGTVIAANLGYRWREAAVVGDLTVDDAVLLGVGGEVPWGGAGLSVLAALDAAVGVGERGGEPTSPVSFHAGLRWRGPGGLAVTLGGGAGLDGGYGAPDVRVLLALAYGVPPLAPSAAPSAVSDAGQVATATEDGGPADPPGAGQPTDARPAVVGPADSAFAATFDAAVAADADRDGDGVGAGEDRCPDVPEDRDGFDDDDGCPDLDDDRDGVPDRFDRCPGEAEIVNGVEDDDGCPDEGAGAVTVGDGSLRLDQRVRFETGSDVLTPDSEALLDQVARVLRAHFEVRRVRIEGHTDDRGDREMNVDLSERRARRVLAYLVARGVEPWRLEAKGYGPKQPIAPNVTPDGRSRNRRVEFTILERLGPGERPAPASGTGGGA